MEETTHQMDIIQELIECAEHQVIGRQLQPLRSDLGDDGLRNAVEFLLLVLYVSCVPAAARKVPSHLEWHPSLRGFLAAIAPLAEWLEPSGNPDIF
jgi:hypothetical protein